MEIIQNENNTEQKILDKIYEYKRQIEELTKKAKESSYTEEKVRLYKQILEIDNTKEEYVLQYLLCLEQTDKIQEEDKPTFKEELWKLEICISDGNYDKYFKNIERINARNKILNFMNLIKKLNFDTYYEQSIITMEITNRIYYIKKLDYHNKKKVTWDNEELYLNCLYNFWIESLSNIIVYYSDESIAPSEILKSQQYLEIVNKIKEEKDENKKEILIKMKSTLILLNGQFIDYLTALRYFLKTTEKNFDKRFKKIELKTMDDHLLFEDYMQFLSTYRFEEFSLDLVHLWNETFVPLNIKEKKIILANFGIGNIELNENGSEIRTKKK